MKRIRNISDRDIILKRVGGDFALIIQSGDEADASDEIAELLCAPRCPECGATYNPKDWLVGNSCPACVVVDASHASELIQGLAEIVEP